MNLIYDIETKPQSTAIDSIMALEPKFDPDSVAVGNLKDEEKIKKKIIDAGIAHEKKMIEWRAKSKKTCCLDADLGQLSAIGILFVETGTHHIIDCEKEVDALVEFWSICDSTIGKGYKAFGWNTDGFDLPFLFRDGPFFQKFARSTIRTDFFSGSLPVLLSGRSKVGSS